MELNLITELKERVLDEKKRTVVAGVLQEDSLSANGRFYPAHVVRESSKTLTGKRSFIGHETDNVEDIVAKITSAEMKNGVLMAEFKFGTDDKSERIFSKVKEGLVDSVSIRATGNTHLAKVNGQEVDYIESLDIISVDWVSEGGVPAAKVAKVFESAPSVELINKKGNEMTDKEIQELKDRLAAEEKKSKELEESNKQLAEKTKEAEEKSRLKVLEAHKEKLISSVKEEEVRVKLRETLIGNSVEELDKSFKNLVSLLESVSKKSGNENDIVIKASDNVSEETPKTLGQFMLSDKIVYEDKKEALVTLMSEK